MTQCLVNPTTTMCAAQTDAPQHQMLPQAPARPLSPASLAYPLSPLWDVVGVQAHGGGGLASNAVSRRSLAHAAGAALGVKPTTCSTIGVGSGARRKQKGERDRAHCVAHDAHGEWVVVKQVVTAMAGRRQGVSATGRRSFVLETGARSSVTHSLTRHAAGCVVSGWRGVVWQAVEESFWVVVLMLVEKVLTAGQLNRGLATCCVFVVILEAAKCNGEREGE